MTVKYVAGGAARTTGTSPVPPRESKSVPRPPSSAAASSSAAVNLKPAESSSDYGKDVDGEYCCCVNMSLCVLCPLTVSKGDFSIVWMVVYALSIFLFSYRSHFYDLSTG